MLSQQTIQQLQQIITEEYGKELTLKEVTEIAQTMVNYFDLLAKILHRDNENDKPNTTE